MTEIAVRRLFRVVNGGTPTSDEANWSGEVPWATPSDLATVDGRSITMTARTLTRVGVHSGSATVPKGSLLVSTRAPIGYVAATTAETAFNQGCRGLVPRGELDLRFFRYQLLARRDELVSRGQGSTFTELSSESLAAFKVRCPEPSEQREIADFLDAETARIEALIEGKGRMIDLLEDRQQALVDEAVTHHPVEPLKQAVEIAVSNVDKLTTEGQELVQLCNYTDVYYHRRITGDLEFMTASATTEQVRRLGLRAGYVLITKDSEMADDIAVPAFVPSDLPGVVCGYHLAVLKPRTRRAGGSYLYWALRSQFVRQQFTVAATGVTRFGLRTDDIGGVRVPLPSIDIQNEIADRLSHAQAQVDQLTNALHRQVDLLQERRQALITAAVTGRLNVAKAAV